MVFPRWRGRRVYRPGMNAWRKNVNRRLTKRGYRKVRWQKGRRTYTTSFNPLGKSYVCKLKYYTTIGINPGAGVIGDHVFSANGCYDPDITGTGTQPYGFDQMMLFYNHYTVIGSKCTASMINNTTLPLFLAVALRDAATTYTGDATDETFMEPGIVKKFTGGTTVSAIGSPAYVSKTFSARKFFGKNVGIIPQYQGDTSNNPTEQAYYHVMVAPNITTDNPDIQYVHVEIEYTVRLTEPKMLPAS